MSLKDLRFPIRNETVIIKCYYCDNPAKTYVYLADNINKITMDCESCRLKREYVTKILYPESGVLQPKQAEPPERLDVLYREAMKKK